MKEYTSDELLTLSSIDPTNHECHRAFHEFYNRYNEYVWSLSSSQARAIDFNNQRDIAIALSQNTFIDVHKNADKFTKQSENTDIDIKKWLSGFVKNQVKRYLDKNNTHKGHVVYLDIVPDEESKVDFEIDENEIVSYERKLIDQALSVLNDKERSILKLWMTFLDNKVTQDIPKDIKENLAKQYNVKPDSLKQIKKRALDKVRKFINDHKVKTA